jgi:O-antigen ligase
LEAILDAVASRLRLAVATLDPWSQRVEAILSYPIRMDQYLLYSTVLSVFLTVMLTHKGIDIWYGYPIVIVNTAILMAQDRLIMHRHHAMIVLAATVISFIASARSGTPGVSIVAQVLGILVFSIYFFSMLTNFGLSVPRWLHMYCQFALGIVVLGFAMFVARHLHLLPPGRDGRLTSIYQEPSLFVYATLPAFGIYTNAYLRNRIYRLEVCLFFFAYVLAESSLGYLGILLIAFYAALPRLNFLRMIGFALAATAALAGLFFASANFRVRVVDTVVGIVTMNISHVNSSTFAFLSNAYVTVKTFFSNPLIGVGLGGYQFAYTKYIGAIGSSVQDPDFLNLNMSDANSLFFRTTAEMGLLGLCALLGFLVVCSRVRGDQHIAIRNALMPYMIVRMSRLGAWFSLDLYFFVGLFLLNYLHSRALHGTARRPRSAIPARI